MAIVTFFVAIGMGVATLESRRFQEVERRNLERDLASVREALDHALVTRLNVLRSLVSFVEIHPEIEDDAMFERFAESLRSQVDGVRSLQLAPAGIVTFVIPEGDRAAIGHDLLLDPTRRDYVGRVIAQREIVVQGPVQLLQGGYAIIARAPIFDVDGDATPAPTSSPRLDDVPVPAGFWGLATILVDWDRVLGFGGLGDGPKNVNAPVPSRDMKVAIFSVDRVDLEGSRWLEGDPAIVDDDPVTATINLPSATWTIYAVPSAGWQTNSPFAVALIAAFSLVGVLVAIFFRHVQVLRDKAEVATVAKSRFLANVSHEIRTPMNAVLGLSGLALRSGVTPRQRAYLEDIQRAGRRLVRLVDDLLDVSKIEAGRMTVEATTFDLVGVLEDVTIVIAEPCAEKGLKLRLRVDPDLPRRVVGDPLRLSQILVNFAGNAVKFTDRGEIEIVVERRNAQGDTLQLYGAVRDTGMGLAPEQLDHAFETFEQGDASTTRRFGGTGLGLSLAKQLAELMGGRVGVESHPGLGSLFWFTVTLQLVPGDDERIGVVDLVASARSAVVDTGVSPRSPGGARDYGLHGMRVLLAEDNPLNQQVGVALLEEVGCVVEVAKDGREAVRKATSSPYDVVLMDVQMPVLDGLEATRELRGRPETRALPIVAMTASAMASDRQACKDAGMNDFMGKPIEPDELYRALRNVRVGTRSLSNPGPSATVDPAVTRYDLPSEPVEPSPQAVPAWRRPLDSIARDTGIDVEDALRRANGDGSLLASLLVRLADDHADSATQLRRALADDDEGRVVRLAHTLAGSAGYVADHRLARYASDLEAATRSGETPTELARAITVLERRLDRLIDSIRRHLVYDASTERVTIVASDAGPAAATEVDPWATLAHLLAEDDPAAREHWNTHRDRLEAHASDLAQGIAEALDAFDLPVALALVRRVDERSANSERS